MIEYGIGMGGAGSGAQGYDSRGQELGPLDPDRFGKLVRAAESLGFGSIYLADSPRYPDALSEMAYVAGLTTTLKVRTTVIVPMFFQKHPVYLAKQLATVDQLSKGRIGWAVGTGPMGYAWSYFAYPFKDRGKMLDHYMKALIELWTKPTASYECEFFSFKDVELYPKPYQKPYIPIWVGGRMPPATRRAGRLGDGCLVGSRTIDDTKTAYDLIRTTARKHGRSLEKFEFGEGLNFVSVARTRAEAMAVAESHAVKRKTYDASESWTEHFDEVTMEEWYDKYCVIGTPEECAKRVQAFVDLGTRFFRVSFPRNLETDRRIEMMKLWMEEVAPRVKVP